MTRDDIINMAREAGAKPGIENIADGAFLERFYALATAKDREARITAQTENEKLKGKLVASDLAQRRAVRDAVREAIQIRGVTKMVPQGWKSVPLEPTLAMIRAGRDTPLAGEADDDSPEDYRCVYRAMLAAAPQPPVDHLRGATEMISHDQTLHGRRAIVRAAAAEHGKTTP